MGNDLTSHKAKRIDGSESATVRDGQRNLREILTSLHSSDIAELLWFLRSSHSSDSVMILQ